MLRRWISGAIVAGVIAAGAASAQTLGTITLPQAVLADGKVLTAGTYQVRLTGDTATPGVGQAAGSERWVAFMKNGTVAGREVATVIPSGEIDAVAKGPRPRVNGARVDVLKGGDYVRVWINRGTEHYIIHLPPAP